MGLAKRASLSAALAAPSEFPPAADLSTIRLVRRDKGPAPVIALADSRPASEASRAGSDGMFFKKGNATAATFRPAYWTYEPGPSQLAGPVASLEQQLDRRRSTSPSAASIEAAPEEKPLASLDSAPALRKPAPSADPSAPVPDQAVPTRAFDARAELDTEAVQALLGPMPDDVAAPEEVRPTPAVVESGSSPHAEQIAAPLPAPAEIREEPTVPPVPMSSPADPPPVPVAPPPSIEVAIVATPSPPSVAIEGPPPAPPAAAPKAEPMRQPARKRSSPEAATRAEPASAEFDALGATIESVLATRWYGGERSNVTAGRPSRSDIAAVTPSGLIAELATVRKDPEPVPAASRGRRGRIIAALFLVLVFALAFAAALHGRTGYGSMLPMRSLPAIFGAAAFQEPTFAVAEVHVAARERVALS
jgi:hypothetical protein